MPRSLGTPHQALPSGAAEDYLALWRCNETGADNEDFTDAMGGRHLTQVNSPPRAASTFADAATAVNRGARAFNGTTQYAHRTAPDGDEAVIQTLVWGVAAAVYIDALGAACFVELGEYDTGAEASATNTQLSFRMTAAGALEMVWEHTGGTNVLVTTDDGVIAAGYHDIGVACEPDPTAHDKARLRFYVDGECVHIEDGLTPMSGGADASWIIGASRSLGSGVGTPGAFFNGRMDDVVITLWSPSHEWFRWVHARHIRDFAARCDEGGDQDDTTLQFECYARMLVEVGTAAFASGVNKVNLTDIDLTNINGIDFLSSIEWGEDIDDLDAGGSADLVPRFGFYDLSPFADADSPLRDLFRERRRVKFETAIVPCGTTLSGVGPHWELQFDGWALSIDIGDTARPTIAGKGAPLAGAWIEPSKEGGDRTYGTTPGQLVQTAMQNVIDEMDPARFEILSINDNGPGDKYVAQLHRTSTEHGAGRPHMFFAGDSVKIEGTTNYNGIHEVDDFGVTATAVRLETIGGALATETTGTFRAVAALGYKGGKPTIWCPTSPAWFIYTRNEPPARSVAQLLEDWADEIGWRCCYRFHEVRQEFRLKFYDPRSAPETVSRTADMVYPPKSVSVHHEDQRTVGVVVFLDDSARDSADERTRWIESASDSVALRGDGRYYFQIDVGDQSLITSAVEASLLANTVVEDTKDATAEGPLEQPFDPVPQVHDIIELATETDHAPMGFPVDAGTSIWGVVAGVKHVIAEGQMRTTLSLRKLSSSGAPAASIARARRHLEMMTQAGIRPGAGLSGPSTPAAPTVVNAGALNGTLSIVVQWPLPVADGNQAWASMEVHVSTTTGFTPTSATLKEVSPGTSQLVFHGVGAGVTGYVKIVPRDALGNRGTASPQTSFVA